MNVFILCTGRCGSVTFAKACGHITNYSVGHESRDGLLGRARVNYPAYHIEADNRLAWFLGRLDKQYGKRAFYVHLQRNREDVIASFARKASRPAIGSLALPHFCTGLARISGTPYEMASEYVDTVTENIRLFLKDKPNRMDIDLDRISDQFPVFWGRIGAEGDLGKALEEVKERHNKG